MMNDRFILLQSFLQSHQGQILIQTSAYVSASKTASEQIHDHRQIDKAVLEPNGGDIRHPDLIRKRDK